MDELTTIETLSPSVSSSPSTSSQDTVSFERKNMDPNINISSPLPVKRGLAEQKVIRTPNGMLNLDDDREHRAPTIKPVVTTQQNSTFVMVDTPTININNNNNNSNDIIANALMAKSKVKQYQCALCPNDPPYAGASGLWYHMKRHHGAKTRPYNKRKEDEIKAQKKLKKQKREERKMSSALKRGKNIGVKRPRGRPSMEMNGNKGTPPRHPKVKGKKKPKPIIMGKNGKPLSKYMMKKRERMMEKEKAKKKISQLVNNWLQRHDISAEESNAEEEEEEEESSKEEESSEEEDSDSDSSEEEEEDDDDDSSEESGSSSDEDSSDDDDDDDEEDEEEEEEEEEEKPTISRNNEMMKLVKRSNSKSSSKKKFLNNRTMDNDPFLLLAEVAECVSPRMYKRQKRKGNFTTVQIKQIKVDAFPTSPTNRR